MKLIHTLLRFEVWFFILTFSLIFQSTQTVFGGTRLFPVFVNNNTTSGTSGLQGNDFNSITKDGRYVTFSSNQNLIISNDNNNSSDVFLTDLWTGTTVLVSHLSGSPTTPANERSDQPSISEVFTDGSTKLRVAFRSCANDIMSNEGNNRNCSSGSQLYHIYVREYNTSNLSVTNTFIASKVNSNTGNGHSTSPKISGSGQYVVFDSASSNFASGDTDATNDIYRKQISSSSTIDLVTTRPTSGTYRPSQYPSINFNGDYICFQSGSDNLDSTITYTNAQSQVYRWATSGTISMVSRETGSSGTYGNGNSGSLGSIASRGCDISNNGQYVVFSSQAALVSGDTDSDEDIYSRDTSVSITTLISNDGSDNIEPNVSGDARFIAWQSGSGATKLFDRELDIKKTLTSLGDAHPDISENGRIIVFKGNTSIIGEDPGLIRPIFYDWGVSPAQLNPGDFNGDGVTDLGVFRPSTGYWYTWESANYLLNPDTPSSSTFAFGISGDIPTPGDYDGDGKTDYAVFRPSEGKWYISTGESTYTAIQFGTNGDIPAPIDYDKDCKTDLAVFRPSTGVWYLSRSTDGAFQTQFGTTGDFPVPGDYDNDGYGDVAVFRQSTGVWYILRGISIHDNDLVSDSYSFGSNGDKPVQNDYTGDGATDLAVYRPSNGHWFYKIPSGYTEASWGTSTDLPAPGDYDHDGKADFTVFRPSTGVWYVWESSASTYEISFGSSGDDPLPRANLPD